MPRLGAGGDDYVFSLHHVSPRFGLPAGAARHELAMALQPRDLVLLEQSRNAARHLADDPVLAIEHGLQVELHAARRDAVRLELVQHALVVLGGLEQRFRGNAAYVEAGAAERVFALRGLPFLHAGGREAELRSADGRDVAGRAGSDHHHVEGLHISRIRRAGSSSASLILTKNKTASRPSMMRWS